MISEVSAEEYSRLKELLYATYGIELGDNKHYLVSSRLTPLLAKHGLKSISELLAFLKGDGRSALKQQLIDAMTTHETLWFRDQYPFEALKRMIFPKLAREHISLLRVWSAACSTGQEPYSISMMFNEYNLDYPKHPLRKIEIVATDVSPITLNGAREGIYQNIALARGLSSDRRAKFFDEQGDKARVKDFVRNVVSFHELNLISPFSVMGKFHIIFCRNVLIYFSDKKKSDILDRMADVLEPGGHLFMGGSESIGRYSNKYEVERCYGGMVFRLKK